MNWKIIIAAGAILFTGNLYAQTPDGITPAGEDVCDELKGGTPGLYGLCVSYCEAQDFDYLDLPDPSNPQMKILDNYNKKMQEGDPPMPCLIPTGCPCFDYADAEYIASHQSFYSCHDYSDMWWYDTVWAKNWLGIYSIGGEISPNGENAFHGIVRAREWGEEPDDQLSCFFKHTDHSIGANELTLWQGDTSNSDDRAKYENCYSILAQVRGDLSLECETDWMCETRVYVWPVSINGHTLESQGLLVNDPPENCVNDAAFYRVDWYWGDGAMESFQQLSDGYVWPFPSSHTYAAAGEYTYSVYGYDVDGKLLGIDRRTITIP